MNVSFMQDDTEAVIFFTLIYVKLMVRHYSGEIWYILSVDVIFISSIEDLA